MCRDESGIVSEHALRQHFSVTVHPSRQLMLFSDGFMVTAVEPQASTGVSSCLSLIRRLTAASEQTLSHMLTLHPSLKSSFFNTLKDKRCVLDTTVDQDSKTGSDYHFEAAPTDPTCTSSLDLVQQTESGSHVVDIDHGQLLFGHAENLLNTGGHSDNVVASTDADEVLCLVSKALMLSWSLAATHSGEWTVGHETVADAVAHNFIKLFAVILGGSGTGEKDSTRLQRVLELYRRVIAVASMDHVGQHLPVILVTFISRSAELFLKMRSTRIKGLHRLHGVALAMRFAEQHYARTYSLMSAVNSPRLSTTCYLDHINAATDMFAMPSVFAADRLDWVGLKEAQPVLATLRRRSADDCYCCMYCKWH